MRFVANLSPESAFIINANRQAGTRSIPRHGVGLWLNQEHEDVPPEAAPNDDDDQADLVPAQVLEDLTLPGHTLLLSGLRPALRRECIATIPRERELRLLTDLFYAKIDPIFPLLTEEPWEKHGVMETIALKQCICLLASLDPASQPHLRLPHTDLVLSPIKFRARIAAVVKQSLDMGFIADKIVLLQVCTLMSMYVENQGFGELSTYYCAQAVLHEQTLGFHVGWPDGKAGGERSRRIFWCVYVLDRLNAAINGRPTLIHRRDMDRKVMDSVDDQPPPFKLLIRLAEFLGQTISLYRPHTTAQAQAQAADNDHTFEDLVEASGAQNLSSGLLASLELFYLSVVILRGTPHVAGHRSSSELQWFCAARIVAIASGELKTSLVFWPILPYSVTVAASVAYRSLRSSPMPYNRRRAYMLFQDSCEVLSDLSKVFLTARAMARLARETMQEVERVATERTRRDSIRLLEDENENMGGSTRTEEASVINYGTRESRNVGQSQSLHVPGPQQQSLETGVAHVAPAVSTVDYVGQTSSFFSGFEGEAGIFGSFDPSFDLGRVDAIFSANLDLSVPYFAEDWPEPG